MYLDQEYVDVLKTKDAYMLLESATREDCIYKLDVMNDIMCSMELTKQEVSGTQDNLYYISIDK